MEGIKTIKLDEIETQPLPGVKGNENWGKAGWVKRIMYPPNIMTKGTFFGVGEINPGYSPDGWHTHTRFKSDLYEVVYPKDFEEIYHIISGSGIVQWKTEEGKIQEKRLVPVIRSFSPQVHQSMQCSIMATKKWLWSFADLR